MEKRAISRVVVIGAGLAGVGAAWRLSRLGFDVRVLEREARAGGRAAGDSVEGFRFEPAGALLSGADRELLAWMDELGLRDEMLPLRPAVPAQVFRGRVGAIDPRGLFGVAAIPGVRRLQAARLVRLPRLVARFAAQLEPEAPERAAALDDRSLHDFGRLYFGESVVERWMAPLVGPLGDSPDTSRVLFLRRYPAHAEALMGLPRATLAEIADAAASRLTILTGVEAVGIEPLAEGGLRVRASERGRERLLEADAVVVAAPAPEAARVARGVLSSAEREGLARVRYAPRLALAIGLRRALHPHPRWLSIPPSEAGPLASVALEPGVAGGRVPSGRGLAVLEARLDYAAAAETAPDDAVVKELREAFEGLLAGARGAAAWTRLYRLPLATPRFDVGRYREIAAFERVGGDQRRSGRKLYFAGDYLMDPSWNGALLSGQRAARAVHADLAGVGVHFDFPAAEVRMMPDQGPTEAVLESTRALDRWSVPEILAAIHREDRCAWEAVGRVLPAIEQAVGVLVCVLGGGGRWFNVGAGTSGRMGALDAAEIPPTFGLPPDRVQMIIAGGEKALHRAVEGAEDNPEAAAWELRERGLGPGDAVVAISASGNTPFTLGSLEAAHAAGARTIAITCDPASPLAEAAEIAIVPQVGPEVIAGSTRMKGGLAQKMVLHSLSTAVMVRLGLVDGNLMTNLATTSEKLRERAVRIVMALSRCDEKRAAELLAASDGNVSAAVARARS